ncbi:hypothetical protein HW114_11745 [Serratia symbiotica]|uniref:hypothetical protein n=1 Tax=Serratia symbiotica TaxID=138074 RepID=UPI0018875C75|nr:hypothetical protein [Serratia symbiotica]MBF1996110.1 hypothetical protein [Serratia symbiotica]
MLKKTDSMYIMRDIEKSNNLLRGRSLSAGDVHTFSEEIKKISNSPLSPRHTNLMPSSRDYTLNKLVKVEYNNRKIEDINAKNYVYCGAAATLPINNLGMSIDNDGHLILIKGTGYDLFEGIFKKYTTGYEYKTSRLISSECDKKFKELYIDDNGLLVGNEKNTERSYIINITIPEVDINRNEQFINIKFFDYLHRNKHDDLTFKIDNDFFVSYVMKEKKLYLKSIQRGNSVKDYSCLLYEIKIPLSSGYSLSSIKRSMNFLQIVVQNGEKKRILFIDPKHISNHELSVSKASHKPPQDFSSRLGSDPHEKYHSGLPFSSDRKGNFSSKTIPLFSSIIDNFRVNIKHAKNHSIEGEKKEAMIHFVKAFDPGFTGVTNTIYGLSKSAFKLIIKKISNKETLYDHNLNIFTSQSKYLSKVTNNALGLKNEQKISESIINLANEIKPGDALYLTSANKIAAFFGIAAAGIPLAPGWFAGIVTELSDRHNLILSKTVAGNIRLSFNNRHKAAALSLAGTGQGLETNLLNSRGIDYMSVMPFEANAIIVTQFISGNDFSFDMSVENFNKFATQLSDPQRKSPFREMIINEAEAKKIKEKEFVIKVEAKSELRFQVGSMVGQSIYMVMPRTAVVMRLAIDLLSVKTSTSKSAGKSESFFSTSSENFKVTALNTKADIFTECKIMPIVISSGSNNITWCRPLPLLEEGRVLSEYSNKKPLTFSEKVTKNNSEYSNNEFVTENNLANVKNTPVLITINGSNGVKKGISLKKLAVIYKEIGLTIDTLNQLITPLIDQQRFSQNKSCVVNIISHYEPIINPSFISSEAITKNASQVLATDISETKLYRLMKLEFRRSCSLQHKNASIPMPILNFSSAHGITYDQYLGEIEFQYNSDSDLSPVNAKRRLSILY